MNFPQFKQECMITEALYTRKDHIQHVLTKIRKDNSETFKTLMTVYEISFVRVGYNMRPEGSLF